ncbi:hypothetical protein AB4Z29_18060 [Paenibacillus sp. 2TAB23]|uniref:hypothetical protein n=1 Tax=Paenibacillus sp. 2TAB23 TaxID=3233004 RepID=UPI003F9C24FA
MPRNKRNALEKLNILQEIEAGHIEVRVAVKKYGCAMSTLANWQLINFIASTATAAVDAFFI